MVSVFALPSPAKIVDASSPTTMCSSGWNTNSPSGTTVGPTYSDGPCTYIVAVSGEAIGTALTIVAFADA